MFKSTTKKFKTSKQLLADRHDEVNRYLMLDDVGMTPGNKVNTTNIDTRAEASGVSFKGTAKVLLFASKLRRKAREKASKKMNKGKLSSGGSTMSSQDMKKRLSFARMGLKR